MIDKNTNAERELVQRCKIIYDLTKEIIENETKANTRLYYWAYHEIWMLQLFPKCLASKKAYELFYQRYKKDIRQYGWNNSKLANWKDSTNKRQFMHEHLTTSEDFKQELIHLYKNNQLSLEKIKELILQQRVCWITREEDDILRRTKTYQYHRPDPLLAYKECGIEIYEAKKEDLKNIMIPSCVNTKQQPTQLNAEQNKPITQELFTQPSKLNTTIASINLLETIKKEVSTHFSNYHVHYSMSYIQIWKNTWNNQGKRGVHFELSPQKSQGFNSIYGKENFIITFKLHNEDKTYEAMPQIPKTKVYFKKEYSFLQQYIETSIKELINDIQKIISIDETNIDKAHNTLLLN